MIVLFDNLLFKNKNKLMLYLIIPLLSLGLLIFDSESILRSARFIFIFPLLFILSNYIKRTSINIILSLTIILMTHYIIHPNWASYYRNQVNNNVLFINNLRELKLNDQNYLIYGKETYVLDFWYTRCAACFNNMENLENWAVKNPKFKDNIILVNVLLENENFNDNKNIVSKYGFKSTYTKLNFEELKNIGIKIYPTQLIIKNNKIIFSGDLETDKSVIVNNINDYLN